MAGRGRGIIATTSVVLALAACQAVPTAPTAAVGFRLIIDNGVAALTGQVEAPAGLVSALPSLYTIKGTDDAAAKLALAQQPVANAKVELVDNKGVVLTGAAAVTTDAKGWFVLRGARIGEAAFVRVTFTGHDGQPHFEFSYVRPTDVSVCLTVTLATTLVAEAIGRKSDIYPVYDPAKVDPIIAEMADNLPATLAALAPNAAIASGTASGAAATAGSDADVIEQALAAATGALAPAGDGQVHPAFDQFFDQILAPLQAQLDKATDTFLQVTFTLQSFGANMGVPSDLEAAQHLLIGQAEVLCQTPTDTWSGVTFWLNNQLVGPGAASNLQWSSRVDTSKFADGPYVLTAVAQPKDPAAAPVSTKAFLYVMNTQANGHGACSP